MSELESYPEREEYLFPKTVVQQAEEELRLYTDSAEMRRNIVGLSKMYGATPFGMSMRRFSFVAKSLKIPEEAGSREPVNSAFYAGSILAIHVNLAPASRCVKRHIIEFEPFVDVTDSPSKELVIVEVERHLKEWVAGKTDNWQEFLSNQDEEFQNVVARLAERVYENEDDFESELDFIAGFTFATNIILHNGMQAQTQMPV